MASASNVYAREKLTQAVASLATSAAPLDRRLWNAVLSAHTLREEDFSAELRPQWSEIIQTLAAGKGDERKVKAALNKMHVEQLENMALDFFSLFLNMIREDERGLY